MWDVTSLSSVDFDALAVSDSAEPAVEEPRTGAAPPAAKSSSPLSVALVLKGHTRPIERLASYAISNADGDPTGRIALLSADSLGMLKTWEVWRDEEGKVRGELRSEARLHDIGIYDLVVGDGEIWTGGCL